MRFKQLENLAQPLKLLYPDLLLTPSTYLCRRCYEHALELLIYVKKKKTNILSTLSNALDVKLNNVYDVSIKTNESTACRCTEWVQNVGLALQKYSTVSEKIKILTLLPSSLTKNEILSLFPDITMYMIERAKSLVQEKGVYSEPKAYTDHLIDEKTEQIVMEYYINDDFNCSRQSLNKNDVITVKINDKKEKKVKRFLTQSLKATYKAFKNDYPELRIVIYNNYSTTRSGVLSKKLHLYRFRCR